MLWSQFELNSGSCASLMGRRRTGRDQSGDGKQKGDEETGEEKKRTRKHP